MDLSGLRDIGRYYQTWADMVAKRRLEPADSLCSPTSTCERWTAGSTAERSAWHAPATNELRQAQLHLPAEPQRTSVREAGDGHYQSLREKSQSVSGMSLVEAQPPFLPP